MEKTEQRRKGEAIDLVKGRSYRSSEVEAKLWNHVECYGFAHSKAEARLCSSPSKRFRGLCFSDRNCASVCHTEGFPGGDCQGFRRRCMCQKPCPSKH
ncbi:Defensin Ec-AMP-D1 [Nymphaea thermarum]|nr:Defensin Ec-AMP-D1 [Nymphaea thermarum]